MARYYVNRQQDDKGHNEVHEDGCSRLAMMAEHNKEYLGEFASCHGAVRKAKEKYPNADGCWHCSNACHNG